jgi:3-hydroxyisobutyrate dehydrogenase
VSARDSAATPPVVTSPQPPVIAVLGAGRMGSAIVEMLARSGAWIRVWNRTHARAAALRGERVFPVEEVADAVRGADAVISILSAGPAVRATLSGIAGLFSVHAVLIEASTIDVATMAEVAEGLDGRVVSCAVSGTPAVILAGQASVLVSGRETAKEKAAPFLSAFAARTVDVGTRVEDAKLVKIGLNAVLAGTMELLAESAVLLEAGGVSRDVFTSALAGSVLSSTFSGYKLAALAKRDYTPTFATRDLRKDVSLALSQGSSTGVTLPFAQELLGLLDNSIERGWGDVDFLSLVPRLQAACGLTCDLPVADVAS